MSQQPISERTLRMRIQVASVTCAVALPLCIAYQAPPQPAFYQQWLALLLWALAGLFTLSERAASPHTVAAGAGARRDLMRSPIVWLTGLVALFACAIAAHVALQKTPGFVALPALATLGVAAVWIAACVGRDAHWLRRMFCAIAWGLLIAGGVNAVVTFIQRAGIPMADAWWIAQSLGERPFGNFRQPNLLALSMVWAAISVIALLALSPSSTARSARLTRVRKSIAWFLFTVFVAALVASDSRSGWLAALACASLFAALVWRDQRRAATTQRGKDARPGSVVSVAIAMATLAAAALLIGLFAVNTWDAIVAATTLDGMTDLRTLSIAQRVILWRNAWELIALQPWQGVGYGQFAFAWTLTPLSPRAGDLFDHAHNAALQLAVEFGIPLAATMLVLLLILAVRLCSMLLGRGERWTRYAAALLLAIAVQSLFEYPLWFAHFFLPSVALLALLCACAAQPVQSSLGARNVSTAHKQQRFDGVRVAITSAAAAGFAIAFAWALTGYRSASAIYAHASDTGNAFAAAERAAAHPLYGMYGDYARIMLKGDDADAAWFSRPSRSVLDERLVAQWARVLVREDETARAAYLVARLRELGHADADVSLLPAPKASSVTLSADSFKMK